MGRHIHLSGDERDAVERFRNEIVDLPTWSLMVALPMLESAAHGGSGPRCLFAVLADHLCRRLQLDRTLVLAHPDGVAAGIESVHRSQLSALATTN